MQVCHERHVRRTRLGLCLGLSALLCACAATGPTLLRDGQELEQAGRYEEAVKYYRSLLSSGQVPAAEVKPRLDAASDALAGQKADQGQKALSAGQVDGALTLAGEARTLSPGNARVKALLKGLDGSLMERASSMAGQKPLEAIALLDRLLVAWPDDRAAREARAELAHDYSGRLEAETRAFEQKGLIGNAFLGWLALGALNPADAAIAAEISRRRTDLKHRYQVPVTWEVSGRGALNQAATAALAEMRFTSPFLTLQLGSKTPNSLQLTISKVEEAFNQQVEPTTATKAVATSAARRVPNPERKKLEDEMASIEQRVRSLEDRIDRIQAQLAKMKSAPEKSRLEGDLNKLEREHHQLSEGYAEVSDKFEKADREIEIADYRDVRYPMELYRRDAVISFRLQALSVRPDLPLKVDLELSGRAEVTDEVHPAFLEYGIAEHRLLFAKSDVVLRREALQDLAKVVGNTADSMMNDLLVLELRKGRELAKAGRIDDAAESFVRVLLGTTGEPVPEVSDVLRQKGTADAALVRGEHVRSDAEAKRVKP